MRLPGRLTALALVILLLAASSASAPALVLAAATATTQLPAPAPALAKPFRIMIAGDSIAGGHGLWCPDGSSYGDRWAFGDWVTLSGVDIELVGSQSSTCHPPWNRHEGHGGWTIGQLADNIAGFLAANPADILILRVGVNDANAGRTASQMEADYIRLLDAARAQSPAIRILASEQIGPNGSVDPVFAPASITVARFNRLLPAIVAPYRGTVRIGRNAICTTRCLGDGLHPNVEGYLAIAWITIHQPDGIWSWLSANPPASTDAGTLLIDPFAAARACPPRVITG